MRTKSEEIHITSKIKNALDSLGLKHIKDKFPKIQCTDSRPFNNGNFGCLRCDVISNAIKKKKIKEQKINYKVCRKNSCDDFSEDLSFFAGQNKWCMRNWRGKEGACSKKIPKACPHIEKM